LISAGKLFHSLQPLNLIDLCTAKRTRRPK